MHGIEWFLAVQSSEFLKFSQLKIKLEVQNKKSENFFCPSVKIKWEKCKFFFIRYLGEMGQKVGQKSYTLNVGNKIVGSIKKVILRGYSKKQKWGAMWGDVGWCGAKV